jgi:hypothetical protein
MFTQGVAAVSRFQTALEQASSSIDQSSQAVLTYSGLVPVGFQSGEELRSTHYYREIVHREIAYRKIVYKEIIVTGNS